jgi:lipid-A-disaccharide synthase
MELKRIVPLMAEVVRKHPEYQYGIAAIDGPDPSLYQPLKDIPGVHFVNNDTYNLLHVASSAIVTSGTATLETGLFRIPQMCVYRTGWLEMKIARSLVKVKFISLINLIAGHEVIRELIQEDATVKEISKELAKLTPNGPYRRAMLDEYGKIYQLLDTGSASENAARLMVGYLEKN